MAERVLLYGPDGLLLFPSAAAAADGEVNTALLTRLLARLEGYNGATWDMVRTGIVGGGNPATGILDVLNALYRTSNTTVTAQGSASDYAASAMTLGGAVGAVGPMLFNGTTWEPERNTQDVTLLASAARTATTNTADQTGGRGVLLYLDVTVNPAGAQTLQAVLQGKDSITGTYYNLVALAASTFAGVAGKQTLMFAPGVGVVAGTVPTGSALDGQFPGVLPRTWRVSVVHSAAGAWTYSLSSSVTY